MIRIALLFTVALVGCITDPPHPKDKIIAFDCAHRPDSTTWTDTTEADHFSCVIDSAK